MSVVIGDIGGTNLRLQLILLPNQLLNTYTTSTQTCSSLEIAIQNLLDSKHASPRHLFLAFAGCVSSDRRSISGVNIAHWGSVSASRIEASLGIFRVEFFNDLEACALGLSRLQSQDLRLLYSPNSLPSLDLSSSPSGPRLVVGLGTGLGVAVSVDGTTSNVLASEAGWRTFSARSEMEQRLVVFIQRRLGVSRVAVEHVLGGHALLTLLAFLRETSPGGSPSGEIGVGKEKVGGGVEHPREVYAAAETGDEVARAAISLYWKYVGRELAELCLTYLPTGGIFLTGGVVTKAEAWLLPGLLEGFLEPLGNPVLDEIVRRVSVAVVAREDLALLGMLGVAVQ